MSCATPCSAVPTPKAGSGETDTIDTAHRIRLFDGTHVVIRRLNARDVDAVTELHDRLTEEEQYFRFFIPHPKELREFAEELVMCNHRRCGLGAFDAGRLIGVANYAMSDDPDAAEIGVAVAHAEHLRGVATALLHRLAEIALQHGIRYFIADILAANAPMRNVISDAGWRHTSRYDGSMLNMRIDVMTMIGENADKA
jgi:RimJ/RimL family protein N-acetyltransferase